MFRQTHVVGAVEWEAEARDEPLFFAPAGVLAATEAVVFNAPDGVVVITACGLHRFSCPLALLLTTTRAAGTPMARVQRPIASAIIRSWTCQ